MNKYIMLLLSACLALTVYGAERKDMSVQVKKAEIRKTASFLAPVIGSARYGDRLAIVERKGAWYLVGQADQVPAGWMHESALTSKKIVIAAGKTVETGASSGELALAGKGFNKEVEASFQAQHKDIDFAWVDKMEKFRVTPEEIAAFLKEGGIRPENEGSLK